MTPIFVIELGFTTKLTGIDIKIINRFALKTYDRVITQF